MLGRLFGKNKDASDEPVCYQCGRTLLAGEWTQKVEQTQEGAVSLCGTAAATPGRGLTKVHAAADADDDPPPQPSTRETKRSEAIKTATPDDAREELAVASRAQTMVPSPQPDRTPPSHPPTPSTRPTALSKTPPPAHCGPPSSGPSSRSGQPATESPSAAHSRRGRGHRRGGAVDRTKGARAETGPTVETAEAEAALDPRSRASMSCTRGVASSTRAPCHEDRRDEHRPRHPDGPRGFVGETPTRRSYGRWAGTASRSTSRRAAYASPTGATTTAPTCSPTRPCEPTGPCTSLPRGSVAPRRSDSTTRRPPPRRPPPGRDLRRRRRPPPATRTSSPGRCSAGTTTSPPFGADSGGRIPWD